MPNFCFELSGIWINSIILTWNGSNLENKSSEKLKLSVNFELTMFELTRPNLYRECELNHSC